MNWEKFMNQEKTPTVYLVDCENVNDVWIRLVTTMEAQDEILVFYTEKSPHMSYEKVIELTQLSDRPIRWIKCVEGSNALDFQLVTELGARVATEPGHTFVIVCRAVGRHCAGCTCRHVPPPVRSGSVRCSIVPRWRAIAAGSRCRCCRRHRRSSVRRKHSLRQR